MVTGSDSGGVITTSNPAALRPGGTHEIPATQVERIPSLLEQLAEPGVARGLITLLFAMGTIWIAIQLSSNVINRNVTEQQYARGKDILTILVGLFGTIIGFYFGTSHVPRESPDVAEQVLIENSVTTPVTPATAPDADEGVVRPTDEVNEQQAGNPDLEPAQ